VVEGLRNGRLRKAMVVMVVMVDGTAVGGRSVRHSARIHSAERVDWSLYHTHDNRIADEQHHRPNA
jgi:hypothetical protein